MPKVFFTSDPHFGHAKAALHRGFDTPEAHDAALVSAWNAVVGADDVVWVLGDLAASSPTYALELLATLPGEKHLISGNHDQTHPMHRDAHLRYGKYLEVFASVQSAARRRIDGREVLLSHFPYERDRGPARHTQWRLRDEGLWLLHGHTHGKERVTVTNRRTVWTAPSAPGLGDDRVESLASREIHVGVDAWDLAPVDLETVAVLIQQEETRREAQRALNVASRSPWPTRAYLGGGGFEVDALGAVTDLCPCGGPAQRSGLCVFCQNAETEAASR